jgi:hypothetical protein
MTAGAVAAVEPTGNLVEVKLRLLLAAGKDSLQVHLVGGVLAPIPSHPVVAR